MLGIPSEVKKAVASLDGEPRWKIIEILLERKELSYSELMEISKLSKSDLNYHLDILVKGAILDKYSKNILASRYGSYYAIAPFGSQILKGLQGALNPRRQMAYHS